MTAVSELGLSAPPPGPGLFSFPLAPADIEVSCVAVVGSTAGLCHSGGEFVRCIPWAGSAFAVRLRAVLLGGEWVGKP